jgi:3-isopropylmalate/(R)-2-methylmalate dehydratase large subunit
VAGRPYAPQGADFAAAVARWRGLPSDEGASYDAEFSLDADELVPMITYGTNPGMGIPITAPVPTPEQMPDASSRLALDKALAYMGLEAGKSLLGHPVDVVFIGSCTNSRISDLRQAAGFFKGRKVAQGVRVMVVPGSQQVKRQAEAEGLDLIFKDAGAEWREAGCSACLGMNPDQVPPGKYALSTSNRNFEGRQGPRARTMLASPLTAAATALTGKVTDPRTLLP